MKTNLLELFIQLFLSQKVSELSAKMWVWAVHVCNTLCSSSGIRVHPDLFRQPDRLNMLFGM